jgi:16S rRNA processing protein RimM
MYGFEGAVTVKLEKTFIENIPDMESVFIETEGKPVPFFIEESEYPGGDILRLKFSGYSTFESVKDFAGCRIFLTTGKKQESGTNVKTLIGYKVCLSDKSLIGTISEIIENPGQWLLQITAPSGKKLLIPFHEDLIRSIDNRKNTIVMDLPEGLTDLN